MRIPKKNTTLTDNDFRQAVHLLEKADAELYIKIVRHYQHKTKERAFWAFNGCISCLCRIMRLDHKMTRKQINEFLDS